MKKNVQATTYTLKSSLSKLKLLMPELVIKLRWSMLSLVTKLALPMLSSKEKTQSTLKKAIPSPSAMG